MIRPDEKGFSLIEVLLGSALLAIVSLGFATLMTGMQSAQNSVKYRSDADTFAEELRSFLSSPAACLNSFGSLQPQVGGSYPVTTLFDGTASPGQATYNTGGVYGDRSLVLNSMVMTNFVPGPNSSGMMTFVSTLGTAKVATGAQVVTRAVNVNVLLDTNGQVSSCVALAKMSDGLWVRDPNNNANIFYNAPATAANGGNVGIGRVPPLATLDVAGDVRAAMPTEPTMPVTLVPDTLNAGGSGWLQGLGINSEFIRATGQWQTGGDGANSGASAILMDQAEGALRFITVPNAVWGRTRSWTPAQFMNMTRMYLDSQGNLGLGVTTPTHQLELSTDSAAKAGTATWTVASDERLKDIRAPFLRGLEAIENIHPIYYRYRAGNPLGLPTEREYVGVGAKNVLFSVPEAVSTDERGYMHVTDDAVIWTMLNAIKDLSRQNRELKKKLDRLAASVSRDTDG